MSCWKRHLYRTDKAPTPVEISCFSLDTAASHRSCWEYTFNTGSTYFCIAPELCSPDGNGMKFDFDKLLDMKSAVTVDLSTIVSCVKYVDLFLELHFCDIIIFKKLA